MNQAAGKSLCELLESWQAAVANTNYPQPPRYEGPDVRLTAIVEHTATVHPGACFVARVRESSDGHPFIPQAVARGASLILGQRAPEELPFPLNGDVPYLQTPDSGLAEAWLAAAWEGFPGRELVMIGITGTDGKTTTANLLHNILQANGIAAGLLSTLRAVIGQSEEPLALHVTTPESPVIQRYLRRMLDAGMTHCILEATSHGLAQNRVAAIDFDLAVVTNITHEHLDYHGDWESYLAAKSTLFRTLQIGDWSRKAESSAKANIRKCAILNGDDRSFHHLQQIGTERQLVYRLQQAADVYITDIQYNPDATHFTLHLPSPEGGTEAVEISSHMVGDFNLYNMMAAAASAHHLGLSSEEIRTGLQREQALRGRMERVNAGQPFLVVVDFAHTPNALEKAIAAGRRLTKGRIITVFGSAGKRDVAKRRLMAEVSARDADLTILTAEDPRTEALDDILQMMAEGCTSGGGIEAQNFWRVRDRGRAIHYALQLAQEEDLVLVCGKGHEQSMCFGATEYPWDDANATRSALKAQLAGEPMPDLGLPTF